MHLHKSQDQPEFEGLMERHNTQFLIINKVKSKGDQTLETKCDNGRQNMTTLKSNDSATKTRVLKSYWTVWKKMLSPE